MTRCCICGSKGNKAIRVGIGMPVAATMVAELRKQGLSVHQESPTTMVVGPLCRQCRRMMNTEFRASLGSEARKNGKEAEFFRMLEECGVIEASIEWRPGEQPDIDLLGWNGEWADQAVVRVVTAWLTEIVPDRAVALTMHYHPDGWRVEGL